MKMKICTTLLLCSAVLFLLPQLALANPIALNGRGLPIGDNYEVLLLLLFILTPILEFLILHYFVKKIYPHPIRLFALVLVVHLVTFPMAQFLGDFLGSLLHEMVFWSYGPPLLTVLIFVTHFLYIETVVIIVEFVFYKFTAFKQKTISTITQTGDKGQLTNKKLFGIVCLVNLCSYLLGEFILFNFATSSTAGLLQ